MGSFENAWKQNISMLAAGMFQKPITQIIQMRASINPEKEFKKIDEHGMWLITEDDTSFPSSLREIPHAPLILYGKGTVPDTSRTMIGVVGTRRPTAYGKEVAETITEQLARAGMTIVSGLAVGIDTIAHEAALSARAPNIAVIGSGIDEHSLFPQENVLLSQRIIQSGGTIFSEYGPGTPARKEYFPLRNRIIAGLSRGIFVAEARERSGALITAQFALEQNRDVFAAPGSIFSPTSAGPNLLIQQGAKLVISARDICEDWGMTQTQTTAATTQNLDNNEKTVVELLEQELSIDDLHEKTGIETSLLMSVLTLLELKGYVRQSGNNIYRRVS